MSPDDPDFKALVRHLVERGVAITSTLTGYESRIAGRPPIPESSLDAMAAPVREYYLRSWAALQETPSSAAREGMAREMARERAFVEAGGLLVAGTDPTSQIGHVIPGYSNQRQVELLHEAGFTTEQAIRIGSLNGAIYLGREEELGSIAAGKLADLVVVEGDPALDMTALRNVRLVFKDGIGYDPTRLYEAVRGAVGLH